MAPRSRRAAVWSRTKAVAAPVAIVLLIAALVMVGLPGTAALFTSDYPNVVNISTSHIFRGERVTPAFSVHDRSGGTAVDASNPIAFAGDGLLVTTANWSTAFAADRYVEVRLNAPLPGGIALTSTWFELKWTNAPGSNTCLYFDVSDASGTPLESHGSAGSPDTCASGPGPTDTTVPLSAVATTDDANGARIRIFFADTAAANVGLDAATLRVGYGGDTFRLYPVDLIDAADTTPALLHWGLAGP